MTENVTDWVYWGGRFEFGHRGKVDAFSMYGGVTTDLNASNVLCVTDIHGEREMVKRPGSPFALMNLYSGKPL